MNFSRDSSADADRIMGMGMGMFQVSEMLVDEDDDQGNRRNKVMRDKVKEKPTIDVRKKYFGKK